jgi:cobalt-zinc-cadmium resistance protein CzcA
MLDRLVTASLEHRAVVLLLAALLVVWGVFSFQGLTIEAFPDPTDTQVQVITRSPGQPAEEMERQVSIPIERAVNGTPGLARVRAINLFGLSYVTLTFREGVDVLQARAQTLERLREAELPDEVVPELGSLSTPIGEIFRYTLRAPGSDPLGLRTLQDWVVRPRLLRVDGVADVVSYGGLVREIEVRPDPVAMAAKGLTMGALEQALRAASRNASGGILERGPEQIVIRSEGLFASAEDIRRVAVATRAGTPIPLSEVASVQEGWTPRQGIVGRGEDPDAVEGIVLMRRGRNPSEVLAGLHAEIDHLHAQVLPEGVRLDTFYDRSELVASTLETVARNLAEGATLVVLVLFVFLLDLRAALIVASVIPLSLLTAFIYLATRGMSANLISMGAVDFGIIVDGAVVIIEAIVLQLSLRTADGAPMPERILAAVRGVVKPTVSALLIIIAAYVPIFLLQRVEGRIFAPLAHTVVAALVGGLLAAVTVVPALASLVYRKPLHHRESPLLTAAASVYLPGLRGALRRPVLVLTVAIAALVGAVRLLGARGSEFLPELNEGALYLTFSLPANSSLTEGRRMAPVLTRIIDQFPEVEAHLSQLGRPEDGTDPTLSNNLEFFVKLRPMTQWPDEHPSLGALIERMEGALAAVPGLEVNFSQPIRDNVNENISGQFGQIALKIYADDLAELQRTAEVAKAALATVPGIADLGIVKSGEVPQLHIRPRRALLGRFGVTMADVQDFLSTALGGRPVGELWEGDRSFAVVLRLPERARDTVEAVESLRIPTPGGALVPLRELADVGVDRGRAAINRENGRRYVGLRMNIRGRDLGSFVREAQAVVATALPRTTQVEWGGEFESKERAMHRLTVVVPVALALTLLLLFSAFGSLPLALLVLLNVPFALVGGAIGLWFAAMPVSIAAMVGFIALVGQAALNGVLVLSAIEERRKSGIALDEAIVGGAAARLRPVLMTAALAALGLLPAAFSHAMGAETQRPIAVVIVGGTVSAALLTLIVLPVMYSGAVRLQTRFRPVASALRRGRGGR